ncbi:MAG: YihY/virulence factor BrkB family protein [Bacteroidetes bacterium]|nr:MAG: YihY/virulence factor BrkB family protein [Bacteroidota bacterium]
MRRKWLIHRLWLKQIRLLQRISLPGFKGMNLYEVLRFFYLGLTDSKFTLMASAMSYQFFFSLFPTLLLMLIVLPRVPIPHLKENVIGFIQEVVPPEGLLFVETIVQKQFERPTNVWLLILSTLLALWGALRGIIATMKAFTKNEEVFKKRNWLEMYRLALTLFMAISGIVLAAVVIQLAFEGFSGLLADAGLMGYSVRMILSRSLLVLIYVSTLFLVITTIYHLAPATDQRWKMFSPGAVIATLLTILAIYGLRVYFAQFGQFNQIYGSLGAIILLMVWFYYISMVLLIGFELNAAIDIASYHKRQQPGSAQPE